MRNPIRALARRVRQTFNSSPDPLTQLSAAYDQQGFAVMRRWLRADANCVDVGCHQGDILREMIRHAPRGRHFAFEPLPHLAAALTKKFPRVSVHELALNDAAGETSFQFVTSNPGYSGLLRRRYDRPHEEVTEIKVKTARLDDVLPAGLPVALIKIDVEGAELGVLRGAVKTLSAYRPVVIFEHGLGAADCYGTTPEQVHELLAGCGLRVWLMADWLAGREALTGAEFAAQFYEGKNFYFMAAPPGSSAP